MLTDLPTDIRERAARVKLAVFDVDGVLTDGKLWYTADGHELKAFNVLDGLGMKRLMAHGVEVAIITARLSHVVAFVVDERFLHDFIHDRLLIRVYDRMMRFVAGPVDRSLIDRGIENIAVVVKNSSLRLRKFQTGYVRQYFVWFVFGVTLMIGYLLIRSR